MLESNRAGLGVRHGVLDWLNGVELGRGGLGMGKGWAAYVHSNQLQ